MPDTTPLPDDSHGSSRDLSPGAGSSVPVAEVWEAGRLQAGGTCISDTRLATPYTFGEITVRLAGSAKTICVLPWDDHDRIEVEARANLIAAAPEMLDALEDTLFPLTEFMRNCRQDGAHECAAQVEVIFNKARAAIAKATAQ